MTVSRTARWPGPSPGTLDTAEAKKEHEEYLAVPAATADVATPFQHSAHLAHSIPFVECSDRAMHRHGITIIMVASTIVA